MAPKPRFADGEKVLCFHGPLLYEAKCLKSQLRDKHMKYFIHYSGWNKNWDEWVPECRVLKYNEANLEKQKELCLTHTGSKKGKGAKFPPKKEKEAEKEKESVSPTSSAEKPKIKQEKRQAPCTEHQNITAPVPEIPSPSQTPTESKKKLKVDCLFVEEVVPEPEIKINFPTLLKNWLIDDNDLITRQKKILSLPSRVTVEHIIAGYVKEKVSVKGLTQAMEKSLIAFANDIRHLFNVALGKMLLYKFERPQYGDMLSEYPDSSMCETYGAVHLLRLFTNMPSMLKTLPIKRQTIISVIEQIEDFIKYISQNPSFFNLNDYAVASPEYDRRAL